MGKIIKLISRKDKSKQSKILKTIEYLVDLLFDDNYGIYKTNAEEFTPKLQKTKNSIIITITTIDGVIE